MNPPPPQTKKPRPGTVTFAVWLQALLAVFLIASAVLSAVYGADAQAAFEAELARQGIDQSQLPGGSEPQFSGNNLYGTAVVAIVLLALAFLNAAAKRWARVVTWVLQPLILICGGFIFAGQLFLGQILQYAFDNSGDAAVEALDAEALVEAAYAAYPSWSVIVDWGVVALATLGSLLVIILLAVPSANEYFRKPQPYRDIPGAPPQ